MATYIIRISDLMIFSLNFTSLNYIVTHVYSVNFIKMRALYLIVRVTFNLFLERFHKFS